MNIPGTGSLGLDRGEDLSGNRRAPRTDVAKVRRRLGDVTERHVADLLDAEWQLIEAFLLLAASHGQGDRQGKGADGGEETQDWVHDSRPVMPPRRCRSCSRGGRQSGARVSREGPLTSKFF